MLVGYELIGPAEGGGGLQIGLMPVIYRLNTLVAVFTYLFIFFATRLPVLVLYSMCAVYEL